MYARQREAIFVDEASNLQYQSSADGSAQPSNFRKKNFFRKNRKKLKSLKSQHQVCLENPNLKAFEKIPHILHSKVLRVGQPNNAYFAIW